MWWRGIGARGYMALRWKGRKEKKKVLRLGLGVRDGDGVVRQEGLDGGLKGAIFFVCLRVVLGLGLEGFWRVSVLVLLVAGFGRWRSTVNGGR